jgi:hypothetical protein
MITRGGKAAASTTSGSIGRRRIACAATVLAAGIGLLSGCGPDDPIPVAAPTSPGATAAKATTTPDCRNLPATDEVKAAVTQVYGAQARLVHVTPRPGGFFYGDCTGTDYAASAFDLIPGATFQEEVAHQDNASMMKYFSRASGAEWKLIASDSMGNTTTPCTTGTIPAPLAALWNNCRTK